MHEDLISTGRPQIHVPSQAAAPPGGGGEEKGGDFVKKISLMSNYKLGESNDIYEKKLVCTFANQMP